MRFLVLQHVPHEGPGRYAKLAHEKGIELETVELWKPGYVMPDDYGKYAGAFIMGGPQGVNDTPEQYPSFSDEINLIWNFPNPILGTCLGSQLIAHAYDSPVYKGKKECGFYNVNMTIEGRRSNILKDMMDDPLVFHWHGDKFDIPEGATALATALTTEDVQAFSYGNRIGVLWHWEMTPKMVRDLVEIDGDFLKGVGPYSNPHEIIPMLATKYAHEMEANTKTLFDNFVELVARQAL